MLDGGMPKLTLNRVFAVSLAGLLAGLGLLFWLVFHGLHVALLRSAEEARDRDSAAIEHCRRQFAGRTRILIAWY